MSKKKISKDLITDEFLYEHIPKSSEKLFAEMLNDVEMVEHEFSPKFEKEMQKLTRRANRSPFAKAFVLYGQRVAVIALLLVTMVFATTMSVESSKTKLFSTSMKVFQRGTFISYFTPTPDSSTFTPITPTYVPEGYKLTANDTYRSSIAQTYKKGEKDMVIYVHHLITTGSHFYNTEDTHFTQIKISGQEATTYTNVGITTIFWTDETTYYSVATTSGLNEAKKIAKSVISQMK